MKKFKVTITDMNGNIKKEMIGENFIVSSDSSTYITDGEGSEDDSVIRASNLLYSMVIRELLAEYEVDEVEDLNNINKDKIEEFVLNMILRIFDMTYNVCRYLIGIPHKKNSIAVLKGDETEFFNYESAILAIDQKVLFAKSSEVDKDEANSKVHFTSVCSLLSTYVKMIIAEEENTAIPEIERRIFKDGDIDLLRRVRDYIEALSETVYGAEKDTLIKEQTLKHGTYVDPDFLEEQKAEEATKNINEILKKIFNLNNDNDEEF